MKTLKTLSVLVLLISMSFGAKALDNRNERLNLPGDNLNLYAVMNLFQESETLEGFERSLNAEDSKINNLDLNGDNYIDYIRVIDYADGDDHTIVLQVAINERENQDVAVITVFKDRKGQIFVQMIGDEYLYGKDYIIEPYYASSETPNPAYTGNTRVVRGASTVVTRTTYVEVYSWPVVRYIYAPTYVVWHSPWYYGYYPSYWRTWRPFYWDYYYGYHSHWHNHYYAHYRYCDHYRYPRYRDHYYNGHRHYSYTVRTYRDNGRYNTTYSRPDLRSEGSAAYVKRHGNSGSGRDASGTAIGNTGRTKQDVAGRTSTPAVNNRASSTTGRSATGQNVGRSTTKSEPARPTVNNRSSQISGGSTTGQNVGRSATGQNVGRSETKREVAKPAVNNRSSQISGGSTSGQNVGRSETKREVAQPAVNNRSSQISGRSATSQNVGRSETRRESSSPAVSNRSSQTSGRSAAVQSSSRTERSQPASVSKSSPSRSSSSAKPAATRSASVSKSSGDRKGNSGR